MSITELLQIAMDSDRKCWGAMRSIASLAIAEAPDCEEVQAGTWTPRQAEVFRASDEIKDWVEALIDDCSAWGDPKDTVVVTLVRAGFEEVNWNEMARHYLGKVRNGA